MTLEELNKKYGRPTTKSNPNSIANLWDETDSFKKRNILQKTAGFVLDPVAELGTEAGQLIGKGIVRGVQQFQSPEQREITEANLQRALNTPSQVPGLGTEVKGLNDVTARDVAGQILETGAMFAPAGKIATSLGGKVLSTTGTKLTPGVVSVAKLGSKVAVGAGQGYAFDVAQDLQDKDKTVSESLKPGLGTALGATLPLVGSDVSYLKDKLPTWFVKKTLPKLADNPKSIDNALKKLSYGSVNKNLSQSAKKVTTMGNKIDDILQKPEYSNIKVGAKSLTEEGGKIISDSGVVENTLSKFPNSEYTTSHIVKEMKRLIPEEAKTIDKIAKGTATLIEANNLKKALYSKTKNVFMNIGTPPARKEIGASFAQSIADKIKNSVKETVPIFDDLAKEINLRNALIGASKKSQANAKVGLYDIAGYFAGGIPAVIGERVTRSPGAQLSVAKAVQKLGESEVIPKVAEGLKRLTVKGASTLNN